MKLLFAMVALSAAQAGWAADAATLLAPSSQWNLDYSNDQCLLLRTFGEGDAQVTVAFKPSPMNDTIRLIVATPGKPKTAAMGTANIGFGSGYPNVDRGFLAGATKDKQVTSVFLRRADLSPLLDGAPLALSVNGRVSIATAIDHFAQAMKVLDACELGLLKSWGMSEQAVRSIVTTPKMINATLFTASDYPMGAIVKGQQGFAGARLSIVGDGSVRDCKIVESSGSELLDRRTCKVLKKRARFEPAADARGTAVPTYFYQLVTWALSSLSIEQVKSSPPAIVPAVN